MGTPKDPNYYSCEIRHLGYNAYLDVDEKALCETVADILLDHAPLSREELETVLNEEGLECYRGMKFFSRYGNAREYVQIDNDSSNVKIIRDCFVIAALPLSAVTRQTLQACGVIT